MLAIFLALAKLVAAAGCSREFGLSAVAAVALLFICHRRTVFSDYTISKNTARTAFCVYRRRPRRRCPKVSVAQQTVDPSSKRQASFPFSSLSLSLSLGCIFISISILARISLSLWIKLCDQFKSYARNHNAAKTGCSQLRLCQCNNKVQSHFPTTARAKLNYELQK